MKHWRLTALVIVATAAGCIGGPRATQIAEQPPPTSQPSQAQAQTNQQSGTVNAAAQTDASGWTGLSLTTATPWGVVAAMLLLAVFQFRTVARQTKLLELALRLSHEREMARIQGGRASA